MAKMLRIKSCAQCGECRLGRTANAGIHPDCPLPAAPEPYSESNQPQVEDVVQTPTGLVGHISKIEGKMIWVSRTFDSEVRSSFWTVNNLILLYRPPQPDEEKPQ